MPTGSVIHIEGMGWLGAVIANHLDRAGMPFTWHDVDADFAAWKACTGIVYPAGDQRSTDDHASWLEWVDDPWWAGPHTEVCSYWFNHKSAPHDGKYPVVTDVGWARRGQPVAIQVNAPAIVQETRRKFAYQRINGPARAADVYIVAHGFGRRLDAYMWGWTCPVRLAIDPELLTASPHRPTFYAREGRFGMAYAYAIPHTDWWWAGSSLVTQRKARPLNPAKHYLTWLDRFNRLMPGVLVCERERRFIEGWRPKGHPLDDYDVRTSRTSGGKLTITVPPLWHSGVRWSPTVARQVMEAIA